MTIKISYGLGILTLWLDYHPWNLAPWKNGNQKGPVLMNLGMRDGKQMLNHPRSRASKRVCRGRDKTFEKIKVREENKLPLLLSLQLSHIFEVFWIFLLFDNINNIRIWLVFHFKNLFLWLALLVLLFKKQSVFPSWLLYILQNNY